MKGHALFTLALQHAAEIKKDCVNAIGMFYGLCMEKYSPVHITVRLSQGVIQKCYEEL